MLSDSLSCFIFNASLLFLAQLDCSAFEIIRETLNALCHHFLHLHHHLLIQKIQLKADERLAARIEFVHGKRFVGIIRAEICRCTIQAQLGLDDAAPAIVIVVFPE